MSTYKTAAGASRGESYAVESTPWFDRYVTSLPQQFRPLAAVGLRGVFSAALEVGGPRALARWGSLFVENTEGGVVLNPRIGEEFADVDKTSAYGELRGSAAVVLLATGGAAIFEHPASRKLSEGQIARLSTTNATTTALSEAAHWEVEGAVRLPAKSLISRVSVRQRQDVSRGSLPNLDVAIRYTNYDLSMLQVRQNGQPGAQYLDCGLTAVRDDFPAEVHLSQQSGAPTIQAIGYTLLAVAGRSAATI